MRPSGAGLENVHFLDYTFVLDMHCQQLGKLCQLEGICAPFGHGVGECAFCRIYRVFFFTGPPLKKTKSKIVLEYPDWASPGPPKIVKVYGLGLP